MEFITNNNNNNHAKVIDPLIRNSDEVYIAVAFLKMSGLNELLSSIKYLLNARKKISIIAGQNFGLTEPDALDNLRKLFLKNDSAKLYLANALNTTLVFHPKLYLFCSGTNVTIITGSANITRGGLFTNSECSLLTKSTCDTTLWKDVFTFFNLLVAPESAEEVSIMTVKRYDTYFQQQKAINKKSRAIPVRTKLQQDFSYASLLRHFKSFDTMEREELFHNRVKRYKEAKKVLDEIADEKKPTNKNFLSKLEELVGKKGEWGLWHSGSLGRLKNFLVPYHKEFAELVRIIRENKKRSPSYVFDLALPLVKNIYGADVNYVTEIMMTYNPNAFANINKNPITVLTGVADLNIKKTYRIYSGDDYETYCEIIAEICEKLGLRNMLEADTFFNDIYWKVYKNKQ